MAGGENGRSVLLVEDDPSMLAVLRTLLELEGYRVLVAPITLPLAGLLASIRESRPAVILLDVHLRQTSGLDVLRGIREDPQLQHTRVVMCSGMDMADACLRSGADAFLMKPYMPDELLARLQGNPA